jgi:PAS domain S-box-containing protein
MSIREDKPAMPTQSRATILLVEDDPGVARLEQLRLERAGFTVVIATTAAEGLEELANGEIELIILDQRLSSGTSGLEFFRQVKESGYNVPAILVTGLNDENTLIEALRAGVRDFVPKTPNFLNHLEPIVIRVLDQVRTERELAESRVVAREHEARRRELEHEIAQRKRVEGALREAEEYLRLMVESVKDFAIFTVDPQARIVSWNPGAERLFGYAEPEILGQHLNILFTPEDRAAGIPEREIATSAAKGRASDERWHQCKDGDRFFASGVVTPIFDEENKLRGFTKIARDITERKQAEEAVREAAVRLKAIVETAVDGIITIDEQGLVESMNPAAERIFGYTHEEVVGHNVHMLMSEPERNEHSQYLEEYLRTGRQKIIGTIREVRGRRKDGSVFPMELAVSETRLGVRRIFTGIVRDITDFKKAVEERLQLVNELEGERALLNSLLDNAPVGFGFFDHDLRYLRLNPALAEINGVPIDEHIGRTLLEVLPQLSPEVSHSFREVLQSGLSIVNKEVTGVTRRRDSEEERYWLCNFYPVKLPGGALLGAGVVVTDIDDRKRMEEALKDADQRKDQFLAMLAHELRNPLAPISNAVQIMQLEGPNGANFRWSTEVIEDQIKHMTRMVDDLLDVSRITRGKVDLQKETIRLAEVVDLAVEASRPLIEEYHHRLTVTLPPEAIVLEVDPARLAQVLSNLLNNAAKYTDEGGEISLSAETRGREVVVRVRDNGIGISADLLPRVFDLFTQADRTLSRSRGGLGIGLTLVRSLIELHGGRVAAQSAGLGHGSEFVVALPTAANSAKLAPHPAADGSRDVQLPRRRILVVDDKRSNAQSLEVLLRALGQEVYTAYDGKEALEMAREHRPDVILLDIGLPIIDGYEVARRCREQPELQQTTLVAMTGYGQDSDRQRSHEAGFDAHLVKPVDLDNLLQLLSQPDFAPHSP